MRVMVPRITVMVMLLVMVIGCGQPEPFPEAAGGASLTETATAMQAEASTTTATPQEIASPDAASPTVDSTLPTATAEDASPTASVPAPAIIELNPGGGTTNPQSGSQQVYLVPLGDFPQDAIPPLVDYYQVTHGLTVLVLPPLSTPEEARHAARKQLVAEAAIDVIKDGYPDLASDPSVVLIGLTTEDLWSVGTPMADFTFFLMGNPFAIVSAARLHLEIPDGQTDLPQTRLRKLVTKMIGHLYFELPPNYDPDSAVYWFHSHSLTDLDAMGEAFYPDAGPWLPSDDELADILVGPADLTAEWVPIPWDPIDTCRGADAPDNVAYPARAVTAYQLGGLAMEKILSWAWVTSGEDDARAAATTLAVLDHCVNLVSDLIGASIPSPMTHMYPPSMDYGDEANSRYAELTMPDGSRLHVVSISFRVGALIAQVVQMSEQEIDQTQVEVLARLLEERVQALVAARLR